MILMAAPEDKRPPPRVEPRSTDVDSESEDTIFPDGKLGIAAVAPHVKEWYLTFKLVVDPHPEVVIDTEALSSKFINVLNCITTIGLTYLTTTIGLTNIDMVKEFDLEKEYVVHVRGRDVTFSYEIINRLMELPEKSLACFDDWSLRPDYARICYTLCGPRSITIWVRDAHHRHKYLKRASLTLEAKVMLWLVNYRILPTNNDT
ncbi:hypothetical protein RND71_026508 [Anisodus tanguticus]|uniref:Putative plant transposon protein domain-containing protein n=1 Tax=Anisodus tanguticus TaxID=243964 RepID=A0AAE1RKY2_9SOLA|nr:hypothetical protein RND71_026508 [Anisodus tanguticus]